MSPFILPSPPCKPFIFGRRFFFYRCGLFLVSVKDESFGLFLVLSFFLDPPHSQFSLPPSFLLITRALFPFLSRSYSPPLPIKGREWVKWLLRFFSPTVTTFPNQVVLFLSFPYSSPADCVSPPPSLKSLTRFSRDFFFFPGSDRTPLPNPILARRPPFNLLSSDIIFVIPSFYFGISDTLTF